MKQHTNILTYLFLSIFCIIYTSSSQNKIQGTIIDQNSKERLIGANIIIKNQNIGTTSDFNGNFTLYSNTIPVEIECSFIGYKNKIIIINSTHDNLSIQLIKDELVLSDINIVDTRLSEKLKQSPITIEAMDVIAIKETPAASFYEGLGSLKGVDLTSASLGFKIINTRGFNSTSPVRSLQIIDGVDNQSPGLNFSLGNFLGTTELDTKGVEIIVGANSALYGPNAFNGVINMSTKDPFLFPGTSYQIKIGERALTEHCFRYADNKEINWKNYQIGFKINIQNMQANDWEANNIDASYDTESSVNNLGGYDAVNIYGDEINVTGSFNEYPGLGTVHRTGYLESDLADYNTKNFKFNTALHLKNQKHEFIYGFNFGSGTTIYQGDNRYSLKNIRFWQNKLEYRKNDDFFIRFYTTNEDAGDSYDIVATAQALTDRAASSEDWFGESYFYFWTEEIINLMSLEIDGFMTDIEWLEEYGSLSGWQETMQNILNQYPELLTQYHELAREYADNGGNGIYPFINSNSEEFNILFNEITSNTRYGEYGEFLQGTKFYDKSSLYHMQAEKKIDTKYGLIKLGVNGRLYTPDSRGSIFNDGFDYLQIPQINEQGDTILVTSYSDWYLNNNNEFIRDTILSPAMQTDTIKRTISNHEFGAYLGYDKQFLGETLLFNATARIDKNKNFNYLFSPAASMVYKPNERDIIRLSLSSAIRNPTLTDQYLDYNAGPATLIGNLNGFGYDEYFVTIDAMLDCLAAENSTLGFSDGAALKHGKLEISPIKPEEVKTLEIGFRTTVLNKIYIDASYYYSLYNNFIGYQFGATYETAELETITANEEDVNLGWAEYIGQEIDNYTAIVPTTTRFWRVAANASGQVKTQGFSIGMNYYMTEKMAINSNYSWNKLINEKTDPLVPAFNTPEHKFNIGFSNKFSLGKNKNNKYNLSTNYKWIKGFIFEGSPQFTGIVPSYGLIDSQLNRDFQLMKKFTLTSKIGVSNLLNNKIYQVYGGPRVGRLIYFALTINID